MNEIVAFITLALDLQKSFLSKCNIEKFSRKLHARNYSSFVVNDCNFSIAKRKLLLSWWKNISFRSKLVIKSHETTENDIRGKQKWGIRFFHRNQKLKSVERSTCDEARYKTEARTSTWGFWKEIFQTVSHYQQNW